MLARRPRRHRATCLRATLMLIGQHLGAGDYVVEWSVDASLTDDSPRTDHVLRAAHVVHDVHYGERQRRHDLVGHHGFGIGLRTKKRKPDCWRAPCSAGRWSGREPGAVQHGRPRRMRSSVSPSLTRMRSVPLEHRSRNSYGNLAHEAIAAIGAHHGFHDDLLAGSSLGNVGARLLRDARSVVPDKIEIELRRPARRERRRGCRRCVQSDRRCGGGERLRAGRCPEGANMLRRADVGVSLDAEHAIHAVGDVLAVLVGAAQAR